MAPRKVSTGLVLAICALAPFAAQAEIYRWVDAAGGVTFSDKPPPDGVRVTDVIHVTPTPQATADAAHDAQMRMLTERVHLLELELDRASRVAAAPPQYVPQYTPAPVAAVAPPACDPSMVGCDAYDYSPYVPVYLWGGRPRRIGPEMHRPVAPQHVAGRGGGGFGYVR